MSYVVIGKHGFIGSALAARLGNVTSYPTAETQAVFHFGGYTHQEFECNPDYFIKQSMTSFMELLPWCAAHGVPFIYASSALVYEKDTVFARFKKTLEQLASCYNVSSLGLRIFPVYGPGEKRSAISQWCSAMAAGQRPTVYGDGTQRRDFIYIDDVVEQIVSLAEPAIKSHSAGFRYLWREATLDIGTGEAVPFNQIIAEINSVLDTHFAPQYVPAPTGYSDGISSHVQCNVKTSISQGIRRIIEWNSKKAA